MAAGEKMAIKVRGGMYPNLKKGLAVGFVAGLVAAVLVFGVCVWESAQPAATVRESAATSN
jgi:hypothetical protein